MRVIMSQLLSAFAVGKILVENRSVTFCMTREELEHNKTLMGGILNASTKDLHQPDQHAAARYRESNEPTVVGLILTNEQNWIDELA